MGRMATRRRWLQFSLRGFLVVLTISCLTLAWKVERAREQHEAVEAIGDLGWWVFYDWQLGYTPVRGVKKLLPPLEGEPPDPDWLWRLGGHDLLHEVWMVDFTYLVKESEILESIPHLRRLSGLQLVIISNPTVSDKAASTIKLEVRGCEVRFSDE